MIIDLPLAMFCGSDAVPALRARGGPSGAAARGCTGLRHVAGPATLTNVSNREETEVQDKFWNIVETWGAMIVAAGTFAGVIIHGVNPRLDLALSQGQGLRPRPTGLPGPLMSRPLTM